MTGIVTVYAVFADRIEAERIARLVVEERLAACANVLAPCRSIYRWEGKVEEADEVPVLFKTGAAVAERLIARIGELHSYTAMTCRRRWPGRSPTRWTIMPIG